MTTLEERIVEIERRLAILEARESLVAMSPPVRSADNELVQLDVSNKRYDPSNPRLGSYEDHIWFDCAYTLSKDAKPTRAVKGVIEFCDLFGDVKFRLNVTLNDSLAPGVTLVKKGIGFTYNQFMDEHKWMMATGLGDMKCMFKVQSAIYNDGTSESFP